ncbi:MAG: hypothetical protein A3G84_06405 [Chloroflexi bacterium RIFCSPLOWO2_12_FULL_71_12]|nr:MAG: hypothetical protein A3G84_06405 [Chloroflexi bacterium RIFCSPLOWO2_12_FULL_71_12]
MKILPLSEVKAKLSEIVDDVQARDERVVITRKGKPAAILMSHDDMESWEATVEIMSDPEFMADIRRGVRELEQGRGRVYSDADLDKLLGPAKPGKRASRSRTR